MKTVKFLTKLATVWIIGLFVEGLLTFGAIFATPFNEWNMWGYIAQACYIVAISGIAIHWHEQEELEGLNKVSKL